MTVYIIVSKQTGAQLVQGSFAFASLAALEIISKNLEFVAEFKAAKPAG